jgi:hypothetical protein
MDDRIGPAATHEKELNIPEGWVCAWVDLIVRTHLQGPKRVRHALRRGLHGLTGYLALRPQNGNRNDNAQADHGREECDPTPASAHFDWRFFRTRLSPVWIEVPSTVPPISGGLSSPRSQARDGRREGKRAIDLLIAATALSVRLPTYTRIIDAFSGLQSVVDIVEVDA